MEKKKKISLINIFLCLFLTVSLFSIMLVNDCVCPVGVNIDSRSHSFHRAMNLPYCSHNDVQFCFDSCSTIPLSISSIEWSLSFNYESIVRQGEYFWIYDIEVTNTGTEDFYVDYLIFWFENLTLGTVENPSSAIYRGAHVWVTNGTTEYLGAKFIESISKWMLPGEYNFRVGLRINGLDTWCSNWHSVKVKRGLGSLSWDHPLICRGKDSDKTLIGTNTYTGRELTNYTVSAIFDNTGLYDFDDLAIFASYSGSWSNASDDPLIFYNEEEIIGYCPSNSRESVEFSFKIQSDGVFQIRLYARAENLAHDIEIIFNIDIDSTAPFIEIIYPENKTYDPSNSTETFFLKLIYRCTDKALENITVQIFLDNEIIETNSVLSGKLVSYPTFRNYLKQEGSDNFKPETYNLTIVATDSIGNTGKLELIFSISKGKSAPSFGFEILLSFLIVISLFRRKKRSQRRCPK